MTETSAGDFLSGHGIPVALSKIDTELMQLWGPAAELEGGPDTDRPTVTRVALANLVVMSPDDGDDGVLDTVVARYPCRAIVLRRDDAVGRKVVAEVSALCHLPAPGMPQVCSERILLRAGKDGLDLLPGAVLPILEADLPLIVWASGDSILESGVFAGLAKDASRVIVDLADPCTDSRAVKSGLELGRHPFARDLSWFGITFWRELTSQFFDPVGQDAALKKIRSITIESTTPTAGHIPRVSLWFAAWMAGQLGWKPKSRGEEDADGLVANFTGETGDVAITFRSHVDPGAELAQVYSISITAATGECETNYRLVRLADDVGVEVFCRDHTPLPRMVRLTDFDRAGRVSAALESARDDPPYRNALPHLLWLLESSAN